MKGGALLRESSLFIAYMGFLGWGSAYFYGWGTSFYYGFPWWVVGAGADDVARSLFYAVTVIVIFLMGWGIGVVFFLGIKQKNKQKCLLFVITGLSVLWSDLCFISGHFHLLLVGINLSLRKNIRLSTMRISGIMFLLVMMIVWCYPDRSMIAVKILSYIT
ncbi:hypothetical protein OM322_24250 [Escherichia albertii]|nr:hypothetical protein [Escherichia albertii]MCZ9193565.1 hypothetical protein [Escherichia albertii]MCZ9283160.1 hypothetical protein [Escherichia albertii]